MFGLYQRAWGIGKLLEVAVIDADLGTFLLLVGLPQELTLNVNNVSLPYLWKPPYFGQSMAVNLIYYLLT